MAIPGMFRLAFAAGLAWLSPSPGLAQTDTPFVSLFNGTDLANWTVKSAATDIKNFATVTDGYIHIESPGGAGWLWLYSEKSYTDFVLKLKFSAPSGNQGNSGVNFRSMWDPNDQGGFLNGPQVDIYTFNNWRTGCILDMTKGSQKWFFPSLPDWNIAKSNVTTPAGWKFNYFPEWNDLEIQVKGMNVKTIVNGVPFANFNGEGILNDALHKGKNVGSTGYLALQAHAEEKVVINFKDIKIADLSTVSVRPGLRPALRGRLADGPGAGEVFGLDGRRGGAAKGGEGALRTGLYVVKSAEGPRLRAVIR
jgi:Domain of Unknown Function (DUF1080)